MLTKSITYNDYNGVEYTENFYFNLSKSELTEMELSTTGGLTALVEGIVAAKDAPAMYKLFKEILLKSYGVKSPDGKRFIKSKEISEAFAQTDAYDKLFMEIITDDKFAADFINGLVPKDLSEAAQAQLSVVK